MAFFRFSKRNAIPTPAVALLAAPLGLAWGGTAWAATDYLACHYGPEPVSCTLPFDENQVALNPAARAKLKDCLRQAGPGVTQVKATGYADACPIEVNAALAQVEASLGIDLLEGSDKWRPSDGNEVLAWGRIAAVQRELKSEGLEGLRWSMRAVGDDASSGHEADDRSVVLELPGTCKNVLILDGSGSMESVWGAISEDPYAKSPGICVELVLSRNSHSRCPRDWRAPAFNPYGETSILTRIRDLDEGEYRNAKIRLYSDLGQGVNDFRAIRDGIMEPRKICVRYADPINLDHRSLFQGRLYPYRYPNCP